MPAGARYNGFTHATNTASTTAPMFDIVGPTSGGRCRVYEFNSGSDATPADVAAEFSFRRITADFGTPSAVTPTKLDPADGTARTLFSAPGGTAPTITASSDVYQWTQNGRANFRWVAAPDSEIVIPLGTNQTTTCAGLALMAVVTSTAQDYSWSVLWVE